MIPKGEIVVKTNPKIQQVHIIYKRAQKSTESDVCYFKVDAVFNREPVELLESKRGLQD